MDTIQKGDIAETQAVAELVKRGYMVSVPVSDHCPYDLVLDKDGELWKVQVKYAMLRENEHKLRCSLKRSNPNVNGTNDSYYTKDEIDAYLIYCPTKDTLYWVDFDDAPDANIVLRFDSTIDHPGIRWAEEYEFYSSVGVRFPVGAWSLRFLRADNSRPTAASSRRRHS